MWSWVTVDIVSVTLSNICMPIGTDGGNVYHKAMQNSASFILSLLPSKQ